MKSIGGGDYPGGHKGGLYDQSTDYSKCKTNKYGHLVCPPGTKCPPGKHSQYGGRGDDIHVVCRNNYKGENSGDSYSGYTSMGYPSGGHSSSKYLPSVKEFASSTNKESIIGFKSQGEYNIHIKPFSPTETESEAAIRRAKVHDILKDVFAGGAYGPEYTKNPERLSEVHALIPGLPGITSLSTQTIYYDLLGYLDLGGQIVLKSALKPEPQYIAPIVQQPVIQQQITQPMQKPGHTLPTSLSQFTWQIEPDYIIEPIMNEPNTFFKMPLNWDGGSYPLTYDANRGRYFEKYDGKWYSRLA